MEIFDNNQKGIHAIHPHVLEAFMDYSWPGNVRELENLLERAYILEESSVLAPQSFPHELLESRSPQSILDVNTSLSLAGARTKVIERFETHYLRDLLARNKGRIKESADDAGISTRQLHKLMTKYGIRKEEFKRHTSQ